MAARKGKYKNDNGEHLRRRLSFRVVSDKKVITYVHVEDLEMVQRRSVTRKTSEIPFSETFSEKARWLNYFPFQSVDLFP